jgi:hypothetical protein
LPSVPDKPASAATGSAAGVAKAPAPTQPGAVASTPAHDQVKPQTNAAGIPAETKPQLNSSTAAKPAVASSGATDNPAATVSAVAAPKNQTAGGSTSGPANPLKVGMAGQDFKAPGGKPSTSGTSTGNQVSNSKPIGAAQTTPAKVPVPASTPKSAGNGAQAPNTPAPDNSGDAPQ